MKSQEAIKNLIKNSTDMDIERMIVNVKPKDGVVKIEHTIKSDGKGNIKYTAKDVSSQKKDWREEWEDLFSLEYGYPTWGEMPIYKKELLDLIQLEIDKAIKISYRKGQLDKVKDLVMKAKGKIPEYHYFLLEQVVENAEKALEGGDYEIT